MAGKNRANTLSAILSNMTDLEGAYESALNAEGSALKENQAYLDSIQGRVDLFNNSVQTMWMNFINSEAVKFVVKLGTGLMGLVDDIGVVKTALGGILLYWTLIKKHNPIQMISELFTKIRNAPTNMMMGNVGVMSMKQFNAGPVNAYAAAVANLTAQEQAAQLASAGLTNEQIRATMAKNGLSEATINQALAENQATISKQAATGATVAQTLALDQEKISTLSGAAADWYAANSSKVLTLELVQQAIQHGIITAEQGAQIIATNGLVVANTKAAFSFKALWRAMGATFMSNPVGWIMALISGITMIVSSIKTAEEKMEEVAQKADQIKSEYGSAINTISGNIKTIRGLESEFQQLSKCVDESGNNISLSAEDYDRYREIVESIIDMSPDVVQGYNAEGEAIINKNNLIQESIKLLQEEQRLEAGRMVSTENWKALAGGLKADIVNAPSKDQVRKDFSGRLMEIIGKENVNWYNYIIGAPAHEGTSGLTNFITDSGVVVDTAMDEVSTILSAIPIIGTTANNLSGLVVNGINPEMLAGITLQLLEYIKNNEDILVGSYFTQDQYDELLGYLDDYYAADYAEEVIKAYQDDYTNLLYTAAQSQEGFYNLDEQQQEMLKHFIEVAFPIPTDGDIEGHLYEARSKLYDMIDQIGNDKELQDAITKAQNFAMGLDADGNVVSAADYEKSWQQFVQEMLDSGIDAEIFNALRSLATSNKDLSKASEHINNILGDTQEFEEAKLRLTNSDLMWIYYNISAEPGSMTLEELIARMKELKKEQGVDINYALTYSAIEEQSEKHNEALSQTSEILHDNIKVTQEYKDALVELGISEKDLNECFYESNPLVVKNADALKKLLKVSQDNVLSNSKLAKSQARLQYRELYKKLKDLTNGNKVADAATMDRINTIYQEMGALQKSIAQYSLLEQKLLGASNAYDKLADAQEIDSEFDYGSKAEELINVLAEAFNTAELGTEAAQVAFEGLIPDDVIDKSKTLDEQMQQAYDYFTQGPLSQLFTIEFDDDGAIQGVEMTKENIEEYTKSLFNLQLDGGEGTVFQGTWDEFTLNPAITSLKEFADAIGTTEEVAFAFLTSLEKYDISWLGGDHSTLLDQLMGDDLEYRIHKTTEEMADLEYQVAAGKIGAEDYNKEMYGLKGQLDRGIITQEDYNAALADLDAQLGTGAITASDVAKIIYGLSGVQEQATQAAVDNALAWNKASSEVDTAKERVETLTAELNTLRENGASDVEIQTKTDELAEASNQLTEALKKKYALEEPTEMTIQVALEQANQEIEKFKADNSVLLSKVQIVEDDEGNFSYTANVGVHLYGHEEDKLNSYMQMLNEQHTIQVMADGDTKDSTAELENALSLVEDVRKAIESIPNPSIDCTLAKRAVQGLINKLDEIKSRTIYINVVENDRKASANGTAHFKGTAYKSGSWGASRTETALIGELGPEMVVRGSQWHLVGENGAEFTQIKKGDIIFNHKQTNDLLKNGHTTSRGKAYAGGTNKTSGSAYAFTMGTTTAENEKLLQNLRKQVKLASDSTTKSSSAISGLASTVSNIVSNVGAKINTWDDYYQSPTNNDGSGSSGGSDDFEETIDWIEIRLEELDEALSKLNAELENAVGYVAKNNKIDEMIAKNREKYADARAGSDYYENYAQQYWNKIPEQYREWAKNGEIAITDFTGDASEATVEAIQKYRDYIQKAADLNQQAEEVITEIRDLAIQKIDNIQDFGSVKTDIEDAQTEKLQNQVDLDEESGKITSAEYYTAMMENSGKKIEYWKPILADMQKEFDEAVEAGIIQVGSTEWYENLAKLYEVQAEIDTATMELEQFQNAINDIYWDNFDQLINRLDYLKDETQNLIDLMDNEKMVITPETEDGWSADQVQWTDEGLASLGLYAQQMEIAERKSRQYAEAIDDLTKEYEAGHYSEDEYLEKLNELKDGQYESIEAYYDAQDAIKDLQEARIDEIKNGIDKQIDAYSELIEKQKEALSAEKDLYDFQRSIQESDKNISDIKRQLAALDGDNSSSARAKRAKLEAELAEAQQELQDKYYDRSIEKQQEALDKEQEAFTEAKEKEKEELDKWLEDIKAVVAESLGVVQANADEIGQTLTDKATEYNLTVSDAVLLPWRDGALAVSDYQEVFDTAVSSTTEQLDLMINKWQELIDKIAEVGKATVNTFNQENAKYAEAKPAEKPKDPTPAPNPTPTPTPTPTPQETQKTIKVGGKINASGAKIYTHAGATSGSTQYFRNDPIYVVLGEQKGYLKVAHHKNPKTAIGWFKKSDVKAYAKGTIGVRDDELAWVDELGEELTLHAGPNGRLTYLEKGSGVIPADLTSNLMKWGNLDPSVMLDQNRPTITAPHVVNNEMNITLDVAEIVHIDTVTQDTIPDLTKAVRKELDSYMLKVNNAIKSKVR